MKNIILIIIAILFQIGCNRDSNITSPPQKVDVIVCYSSGFDGDSIIISLDNQVLLSGLGYSDNIVGHVAGCNLMAYEGMHKLTLNIPLENTRGDKTFIAVAKYFTKIDAHFDRTHKNITYEINQIEQK